MTVIGISDIQFGVVSIEGAASNSGHFLAVTSGPSYFAHLNFSNKKR